MSKRAPHNQTIAALAVAPPTHVSMTVAELDAINAATLRAKHMLTLVVATLNEDDIFIVEEDDADRRGAVLTACDIMREAFTAIDEVFLAKGEREKGGA